MTVTMMYVGKDICGRHTYISNGVYWKFKNVKSREDCEKYDRICSTKKGKDINSEPDAYIRKDIKVRYI